MGQEYYSREREIVLDYYGEIMNIREAIKLLEEVRGFKVELVTYKYRVSDEDGSFIIKDDAELISYAEDQKMDELESYGGIDNEE